MQPYYWLLPVGALGLWWAMSNSNGASAGGGDPASGLDASQLAILEKVRAAARAIGVPEALALATCELESNFKDVKALKGASYGPMQVHTSTLAAGETLAQLQNIDWSIARGCLILKQRLKLAKGDSELCRIMYFCGPGWQKSCTEESLVRVRARWRPAAAKWGVQTRYPV